MVAILLRFAGLNSIDGNAEPAPQGMNRSGLIGYPFNLVWFFSSRDTFETRSA